MKTKILRLVVCATAQALHSMINTIEGWLLEALDKPEPKG